jgi:hypothetical protein
MDLYGDGGPFNLNYSSPVNPSPPNPQRFRMTSHMLGTHPSDTLVNAELTSTTLTNTIMGVFNAGVNPTGTLTIEYFDNLATLIATDTVPAGLPAFGTLRIGPNFALTPNYPAVNNPVNPGVFDGWVRIRAGCDGDTLVGWTAREIMDVPQTVQGWPAGYQFHEVYGEELSGGNGGEPGPGDLHDDLTGMFFPNVGQFVRKTMSLVHTDVGTPVGAFPRPWWPGYTAIVNNSPVLDSSGLGNFGLYYYRFFTFPGFDVTVYNPPQPIGLGWLGLPFSLTSFTYEDNDPPALSSFSGTISGRVDRELQPFNEIGHYDGINVLGDPFREFGIPYFPGAGTPPYEPHDPYEPRDP